MLPSVIFTRRGFEKRLEIDVGPFVACFLGLHVAMEGLQIFHVCAEAAWLHMELRDSMSTDNIPFDIL